MTKTTKNKQTGESRQRPRHNHNPELTTTSTRPRPAPPPPPNSPPNHHHHHTHGQGCEQSSTSLSANRITQSKHPDSITKDRAKAVGEASPKIYKEVPHEAGTGSNLRSRGERSTARRQEHRGRLHSNADRQIVTPS